MEQEFRRHLTREEQIKADQQKAAQIDQFEKFLQSKEGNLTERPVKPLYGLESIVEIPHTIKDIFNTPPERPKIWYHNEIKEIDRNYENVILVIVDGLGSHDFNHMTLYGEAIPFLPGLQNGAKHRQLTSVYPSKTAPAMTSIHTGLTPQEHGILGSNIYIKEVGRLVNPITGEDTLEKKRKRDRYFYKKNPIDNSNAHSIYNGQTVYETLKEHGVDSYIYSPYQNRNNIYKNTVMKGANQINYKDQNDAVDTLYQNLSTQKNKAYHVFYWKYLDDVLHKHGTRSSSYSLGISHLFNMLQLDLIEKIDESTAKKTLLLITADHGFIDVNQDKMINEKSYLPDESKFIKDKKGRAIKQTGSERSPFLHIKEENLEDTLSELQSILDGNVAVLNIGDAFIQGYFGSGMPYNNEFSDGYDVGESRFGSIILIPYSDRFFWLGNSQHPHKGTHGGLSEKEMRVPFIIARLSDLK
jgi:hypothetical protein